MSAELLSTFFKLPGDDPFFDEIIDNKLFPRLGGETYRVNFTLLVHLYYKKVMLQDVLNSIDIGNDKDKDVHFGLLAGLIQTYINRHGRIVTNAFNKVIVKCALFKEIVLKLRKTPWTDYVTSFCSHFTESSLKSGPERAFFSFVAELTEIGYATVKTRFNTLIVP
jgi:hypothetical protein